MKYKNKSWLENKYISENLTQSEIADICDISTPTVSEYITKYNLSSQSKEECSECGYETYALTRHLNENKECTPSFSDFQNEVITGLLMSDGNIQKSGNRNPTFRCTMIQKSYPYLKYLDEEVFPFLGLGVKNIRKQGKDLSRFYTRSNPELDEYHDWYSSGEKIWPVDEIELTPTIFKHWYIGDGTYNTTGTHDYIVISAVNEYDRKEAVSRMLSQLDIDFSIHANEYEYGRNMMIQFTKDSTEWLFKYMGEPLPSFEYKWPENDD